MRVLLESEGAIVDTEGGRVDGGDGNCVFGSWNGCREALSCTPNAWKSAKMKG